MISCTSLRPINSLFRCKICLLGNFIQFSTTRRMPQNLTFLKMHRVSSSSVRPEGVLQNWDLRKISLQELEERCDQAIADVNNWGDSVASSVTLSYSTVFQPLLECYRVYGQRGTLGTIFTGSSFAESEEFRSECSKHQKKINDAFVELEMRIDIYEKLIKYRDQFSNQEDLTPELRKCLDKLIFTGHRNGLNKSAQVQERVKAIKIEMNSLEVEFDKNCTEENSTLEFSLDDLKGLDVPFLNGLKKNPETDQFIVTLKYPDYIPIMKKCIVPNTRKLLEKAFNSRCSPQNGEILEKLVTLRSEHATLLGYPNHAAYVQEILMAKNPENVETFLKGIIEKATPKWKEEWLEMLNLKRTECEDLGLDFDEKINMWDFSRYFHMMNDRKFSLNQDFVKEYFPFETVLKGMLEIYQKLLGLVFTNVPDAEVWSDDVTVYKVADAVTSEILGYFYLDLFPRTGKFGHACCKPIQQGCLDANGQKQKAITVLICNFQRPANDLPALFSHAEVESLFHEFGHAMHSICCTAQTPIYFGTLVQSDFLEAPSQMLENWCYEEESLRFMSGHYKTGAPLPPDILENLARSKTSDGGTMTLRQIVFVTLDQRMHRERRYELLAMYHDTLNELMGLEVTPGTNMLANFSHLAGGYDARYYVYLWSAVAGQDMFESVFKTQGILNPTVGKKYRETILAPGGSHDGMDMIKNFIGREPSIEPFLRSKGLL